MMMSYDVINHSLERREFYANISILHSYGNIQTKFEVESSLYSRVMTSANN